MQNYIGDTAHPGIYGYGYRAAHEYGNSQGNQESSMFDSDEHENKHGHTLPEYAVGDRREYGIPHDQNIYHPHPTGHNQESEANQIPKGWHVENFVGHHKLVRDKEVGPLEVPIEEYPCDSLYGPVSDKRTLAYLVYGRFDLSTKDGRVMSKMRLDLGQTLIPYVEVNLGKAAHGELRTGLLDAPENESPNNDNARLDNARIFIYGKIKIKHESSADNEDPARPAGDIDSITFNMDLDDELAEEVGTSMFGECKAVVVCDTCWYNTHTAGDINTNMNHYHYELDMAVHNARRRLHGGSGGSTQFTSQYNGASWDRDASYYRDNGFQLTGVKRRRGDRQYGRGDGMDSDGDYWYDGDYDPFHDNDGSFTWGSENDGDETDDPNHHHSEPAALHQRVMDYRDYHWDNYLHHWNQLGNRQEIYHWDWDARVWIHEPHANYHLTNTDSALLTRDVCAEHPNTRVSMTLMNDETCVCQDGYSLYDNLYPVSLFNVCKGHQDHQFKGHTGFEIIEGHDPHHGHGHASPWNVPEPDAVHEPAVVEYPGEHHHGENVVGLEAGFGDDDGFYGVNGYSGHYAKRGLFSSLFRAWNSWNYQGGAIDAVAADTNKSMIMVCMLVVAALCAFGGTAEL